MTTALPSSTIPTGPTWPDVVDQLDAEQDSEFEAVQGEAEEAEAEYRRLHDLVLHGDASQVEPLDMERATSRRTMAKIRLMGLQERWRVRRNEAANAHMPVVAEQARALLPQVSGTDTRLEQARRKLAAAVGEFKSIAEDHNAGIRALLDEAAGTFTMGAVGQHDGRPVIVQRIVVEGAGLWLNWQNVTNMAPGQVAALTVDGQEIAPITVESAVLAEVADLLPRELRDGAHRMLRPSGIV